MGRRLPTTPRSRVTNMLRQLWLRSRERAAAIKRDRYTCQTCGVKQSKAVGREVAVQVHHIEGIDWDGVVDIIVERVLQDPARLRTECVACHEAKHGADQQKEA
jgi:5-methylcytosine-specific restriction endonuclease McrA